MSRRYVTACSLLIALFSCFPAAASAAETASVRETLIRVLSLRDYNTCVVLIGTTLLGMSGGIVGVFMLLRRQSLIGDVVGHSALPGIAIAFIISQVIAPGSAKNLPMLMTGAFVAGITGALCVMVIDRFSRVRADAALAIVLSLFYGLGTALLTVIVRIPSASKAGLKDFLNGKTASLVESDVWIFAIGSILLVLVVLLLFKEFTLLSFDRNFASASGWRVAWLDALLIGLVAGVTIVGMQTVGLILVVAILIIPAASARFWSDRVAGLTAIAALIGALSAALGTLLSAMAPKLAAGAVIVLSGSFLFAISLVFGTKRGLLWRWWEQRRLKQRIGRMDLLRTAYELIEMSSPGHDVSEHQLLQFRLSRQQLLAARSWSSTQLERLLLSGVLDGKLNQHADLTFSLTPDGAALARRAVRNHRLWELYLINYADVAPSQADYDADRIEHVLGPQLILELELRLAEQDGSRLPVSPHHLSRPVE
ncbi:iron chelate uptake ABC transporter family permease subunit [Planctomicrobium sp. SH668]|uniref:metal ABC transporter permease n=1 Tax=Planctomicrobium sp. SH668 TaxID=3448126 RepID=UPI003F5B6A47